ncbi:MAG: hypothetical protein OEV55_03570 [candidate division Zixibacteria bacterium]|nr:hypothetical protein [candidate division Zixibacteria bacterium]
MKKKFIFGLLVAVLLLFFITSSWALDYRNYLRQKNEEHPWQESNKVPATPQTINNYPPEIKFIFILNIQPILIFIEKTTTRATTELDDSVKNLTRGVKKQDE